MTSALKTICPVCGWDLGFEAWNGDSASDEICPSCGIQFGLDDLEDRQTVYARWRRRWIEDGMKWWSQRPSPRHWDPEKQLRRVSGKGGWE